MAAQYTRGLGHFSVILHQCSNDNVEMAD